MQTVDANGAKIPALGFGTWPMRGEECARAVTAGLKLGYRHVDTAQGYSNEERGRRRHRRLRRSARRDLHHHQGAPGEAGRGRPASVDRGEPEEAPHRSGRPHADPLAEPGIPVAEADEGAVRRQAARPDAPHRRFELHDRASRRGGRRRDRAARHRADRVSPVPRPDEDAGRAPPARDGDHRLLPDGARPSRRRSGDRGDRQGARQDGRAGRRSAG